MPAITGKEIRVFKGLDGAVYSVAFSPNGARVLAGSSLDDSALLWDATTGRELHAFKRHESGIMSVVFSPDGARVLTGSVDASARLWDIPAISPDSFFDIACARLLDPDISGLGNDYGLDLSYEAPICQKENGKFATPLPDPPAAK